MGDSTNGLLTLILTTSVSLLIGVACADKQAKKLPQEIAFDGVPDQEEVEKKTFNLTGVWKIHLHQQFQEEAFENLEIAQVWALAIEGGEARIITSGANLEWEKSDLIYSSLDQKFVFVNRWNEEIQPYHLKVVDIKESISNRVLIMDLWHQVPQSTEVVLVERFVFHQISEVEALRLAEMVNWNRVNNATDPDSGEEQTSTPPPTEEGAITEEELLEELAAFDNSDNPPSAEGVGFICSKCHIMGEVMNVRYRHGSHFKPKTGINATCTDCHAEEGITGFLKSKLIDGTNHGAHMLAMNFYYSSESAKTIKPGTRDFARKREIDRKTVREAFVKDLCRLYELSRNKFLDSGSQPCFNCHDPDDWDLEKQSIAARKGHALAEAEPVRGHKFNCVACHKGVGHAVPKEEICEDGLPHVKFVEEQVKAIKEAPEKAESKLRQFLNFISNKFF